MNCSSFVKQDGKRFFEGLKVLMVRSKYRNIPRLGPLAREGKRAIAGAFLSPEKSGKSKRCICVAKSFHK